MREKWEQLCFSHTKRYSLLVASILVRAPLLRQEKALQAREPQRVCNKCFESLVPIQAQLRAQFSNSQRFNNTESQQNWWNRNFGNSPVAFTLGHEVRKASVTLGNLLPEPKRVTTGSYRDEVDDDLGYDDDLAFGSTSTPFTQVS